MPLSKEQTDNIKKSMPSLAGKEINWTAEGKPDGTCDKLVLILPHLNTMTLRAIIAITEDEDCEVDLKAQSQGINITFS